MIEDRNTLGNPSFVLFEHTNKKNVHIKNPKKNSNDGVKAACDVICSKESRRFPAVFETRLRISVRAVQCYLALMFTGAYTTEWHRTSDCVQILLKSSVKDSYVPVIAFQFIHLLSPYVTHPDNKWRFEQKRAKFQPIQWETAYRRNVPCPWNRSCLTLKAGASIARGKIALIWLTSLEDRTCVSHCSNKVQENCTNFHNSCRDFNEYLAC